MEYQGLAELKLRICEVRNNFLHRNGLTANFRTSSILIIMADYEKGYILLSTLRVTHNCSFAIGLE